MINMTTRLVILFLILTSSISVSFNNDDKSDAILGTYLSPNKKSKIKFIKKDNLYYGKLIWNINPAIKDKNNHSVKLRKENLVGKSIFLSLKYNKYERVWVGKFYDAESGSIYDCNIWLENNNKRLMARGYIEHPMVGRTEVLTRITD